MVIPNSKITDLYIHEDLKSYGYDEDGSDIQLPVHYIVAELPDGSRYAHNKTFEQEVERAEAFLCRISRADKIDLEHWNMIDPCYGSEAYQTLDNMGFFYEREKREELG